VVTLAGADKSVMAGSGAAMIYALRTIVWFCDRTAGNTDAGAASIMTLPGFFEGTGMPDAGWWEALFPDPAAILKSVGLSSGRDAVDLCSGDGWFTLQMARIARHVVAVDIDSRLLEISRARLAESGASNCRFVAGDAYELRTMVPEPVDFVFMANAFHGVPDRLKLANAIKAVLKPGGLLTIVNWHERPREETTILGEPRGPESELRISPSRTIEAVQPSGLILQRIVEIPRYHYGAVFLRPA
jgi:SAM-dependent methyltransferase